MTVLARLVTAHRWRVLLVWVLLAVAGGVCAPRATAALSYDFGLPGQAGYRTNQQIAAAFGSGGQDAPILLAVDGGSRPLAPGAAGPLVAAAARAAPGARIASFGTEPALLSADRRFGVVVVYPRPVPGQDPYAVALPALQRVAAQAGAGSGPAVTVTGRDALAAGGGGGGADVLAETLFGGVGALLVLVVVFGSLLALMPLLIAVVSILTTFLLVWGLTAVTQVSFIVQFLLALIGLGVAIDYALLIVTRWREERARGASDPEAVQRAMLTAGRSVLLSGITVAVSLAALIALPVPYLRSVGYAGLLIPLVSVAAALTLLPALLLVGGPRLAWPHRRSADPESRLWRRVGTLVVAHRWASAAGSVLILLALTAPVLGLRVGEPTNSAQASTGGPAGSAISRLDNSGVGAGLSHPIEILTHQPDRVRSAAGSINGVAAAIAPAAWGRGGTRIVEVWTAADANSADGAATAARVRAAVERLGAHVGGGPVQTADFVTAVYGHAGQIALIIAVVTLALLARALRSIVLPVKALLLNAVSLGAAYGITVLIWQDGLGTRLLFGQAPAGAITVWVPVAAFAFLFGLSMDYEVFLLSRIREEHDEGADTDRATVYGLARTGRLVTSAALILFLAFVSLSRVPDTDVKMLATVLAFGIIIDATLVRGVLAPALVAGLGAANWWLPPRRSRGHTRRPGTVDHPGPSASVRPGDRYGDG